MLASRVGPPQNRAEVVRAAIASPTAELIARALTTVEDGPDIVAHAVDPAVGAPELDGAEVVVVSTWWPASGGDGAPFDVLDAVRTVEAASLAPIVLFGDASEPEFVIEAMAHPHVAGRIRCDVDPGTLSQVVSAVARGATHRDLLGEEDRAGLHQVLEESRLLSGLARAVVVEGATTWAAIAQATGFSVRTVQGSPLRFAPLIRTDLGLDEDHDVTQALLYHWLGAKASYLRSWTRRRDGAGRR